MQHSPLRWASLFIVLGAALLAGCVVQEDPAVSLKEEPDKKAPQEKFVAPPLEELNAKANWIDMPVLDGIDLYREHLKDHKPLVTVAEALQLRNTSAENNEKILSALGQLPQSDAEVDYDATINRHFGSDVRSTNPILISATEEFEILEMTGIILFDFDWYHFRTYADSDYVKSWQTSADRMYDKVVLRDDLTWSDGHPLTAHDVVFSFQEIMDERVPVTAVRSSTSKLRGVHAYDDHTVVFFSKESMATHAENIEYPLIPKHIYEKTMVKDPTLVDSPENVALENEPITAGAYTLASRERGKEIVLERRESWYMHDGKQVRKKPYFKTVRFRIIEDMNTCLLALKGGEVDDMLFTPEQWTTQSNDDSFYEKCTKGTGVEWVNTHFAWNQKKPFFADMRVRKAMSYAMNYPEMLEKVLYGLYQQSNGPFHNTSWMAPKPPPAPYTFDLDKAEQLLDEAGWIDHDGDAVRDKVVDGQPVKFEFTLLCYSASPTGIAISTVLKESLERIGIVCNVQPLERTVVIQKTQAKDYDAMMGAWGTGTDPDTSGNIWETDEGRNYVSFSNKEVDELYKAGRKEFDRSKRAEIYGRIHTLIFQDQPYTWLYYRNAFYGFSKELRGYSFSPRGPFDPNFWCIWKPVQK